MGPADFYLGTSGHLRISWDLVLKSVQLRMGVRNSIRKPKYMQAYSFLRKVEKKNPISSNSPHLEKGHSPRAYSMRSLHIVEEDKYIRRRVKIDMTPVELERRLKIAFKHNIPLPNPMFIVHF